MSITYKQDKDSTCHITVNLQHHIKHVLYVDVRMPPEAMQMIQEQAEWSTPAAMATKIQSIYTQVTTKQIHAAWRELSQQYWRVMNFSCHPPESSLLNTEMTLTFLSQLEYRMKWRSLPGV